MPGKAVWSVRILKPSFEGCDVQSIVVSAWEHSFDIMMTMVTHDGPIEFGSSQSKDAFMTKFGKGEDKQHWSTNPGIVKLALICCKNFRIARECSALLQPFDVLKSKRPNCFGRIFILPVNSWQSKFCSFSGYPGHVCTVYYSDLFSIRTCRMSLYGRRAERCWKQHQAVRALTQNFGSSWVQHLDPKNWQFVLRKSGFWAPQNNGMKWHETIQ